MDESELSQSRFLTARRRLALPRALAPVAAAIRLARHWIVVPRAPAGVRHLLAPLCSCRKGRVWERRVFFFKKLSRSERAPPERPFDVRRRPWLPKIVAMKKKIACTPAVTSSSMPQLSTPRRALAPPFLCFFSTNSSECADGECRGAGKDLEDPSNQATHRTGTRRRRHQPSA